MSNRLLAGILFWVLMFNTSSIAASELTPSIVTLYTKTGQNGSGQGTGFVIGSNGLIATTYHVIQGATQIEVFSDSGRKSTNITLVAVDPAHDLALIRAEKFRRVRHLELSSEMVSPSDMVRVVGSPRGLPSQILFGRPSSPIGVVSSLQVRSANGRPLFAMQIDIVPLDVTVYNGMSGAPVVSENNRVVGVLSGSYSEGGGVAWAIPTKYLIALTKREPERRTVESVQAWPALELMKSSWVSYKRSYDTPLSAKHIRKLEILENAMRIIHGKWEGEGSEYEKITDSPFTLGNCFVDFKVQKTFTFDTIKIDSAEIIGSAFLRLTSVATFDGSMIYGSGLSNYSTEFEEGLCYERAFGDPGLKRVSIALSGDLFLKGPSKQSSGNLRLRGTLNVTDCDGSHCTADHYGRMDLASLELVSNDIIKSGLAILRKQ